LRRNKRGKDFFSASAELKGAQNYLFRGARKFKGIKVYYFVRKNIKAIFDDFIGVGCYPCKHMCYLGT